MQILRTNYDLVECCANCALKKRCKHISSSTDMKRTYCSLYVEKVKTMQKLMTNYDLVECCANCALKNRCKHISSSTDMKRTYCSLYVDVNV